jgi:ubiquinone/menaquinone biosynthesis C-methylase UbiE
MTDKTDKEMAFLHDLFIAPDWDERFADLMDEHLEIPKKGNALYLAVGTGGPAIALRQRAGANINLLCIDENEECLVLARAKAKALNVSMEFRQAQLDQLPLPDNQFDLVLGNASLVPHERVGAIVEEMVRVAKPGALVVLALPTASSFGEFFSIYWEAFHNTGRLEFESEVEQLISQLPTISNVEQLAGDADLDAVKSWTRAEEFKYKSGEQFLNAPLVADVLMPDWMASVPEFSRPEVTREITRLINEEEHEGEFTLSVKATVVVGRKALSH